MIMKLFMKYCANENALIIGLSILLNNLRDKSNNFNIVSLNKLTSSLIYAFDKTYNILSIFEKDISFNYNSRN